MHRKHAGTYLLTSLLFLEFEERTSLQKLLLFLLHGSTLWRVTQIRLLKLYFKKVQQMMKFEQSKRTNHMRNDLFTSVLTSAQYKITVISKASAVFYDLLMTPL
jgi:hypothetical protein